MSVSLKVTIIKFDVSDFRRIEAAIGFSTADILTCNSRKITGGSKNINSGSVAIKCRVSGSELQHLAPS